MTDNEDKSSDHPTSSIEGKEPEKIRVYLSFEGGGAKGLVHLAALYELENISDASIPRDLPLTERVDNPFPKFEIIGVSGTSIGAIIAALYAAGYKARDLISFDEDFFKEATKERECFQDKVFKVSHKIKKIFRKNYNYVCRLILFRRNKFNSIAPPIQSEVLEKCGFKKPTDVFGKNGWRKIRMLRFFVSSGKGVGLVIFSIFIFLLYLIHVLAKKISSFVYESSFVNKNIELNYLQWFMAVVFTIIMCLVIIRLARSVLNGVCSLDILKEAIDKALAFKLSENKILKSDVTLNFSHVTSKSEISRNHTYEGVVRFDHVGYSMPLRIVATDIKKQELKVFSEATTRCLPVGAAVAASAAMPIVFEPVKLDNSLFVDGGLVGNLPAWTFDAERDIDPDVVTISIETGDESAGFNVNRYSPFKWFYSTIYTAIFGTKDLQIRKSRRIPVLVRSDIGILEFDMSDIKIAREFKLARTVVRRQLELYHKQQTDLESVCKLAHDYVYKFNNKTNLEGKKIRAALYVVAEGTTRALKVIKTFNYSNKERHNKANNSYEADDRLLVPIHKSVVGDAFLKRRPILVKNNPDEVTGLFSIKDYSNRYLAPLIWIEREWCIAIPILNRKAENPRIEPSCVVFIDTNIPFESFKEDEFSDGKLVDFMDKIYMISKNFLENID